METKEHASLPHTQYQFLQFVFVVNLYNPWKCRFVKTIAHKFTTAKCFIFVIHILAVTISNDPRFCIITNDNRNYNYSTTISTQFYSFSRLTKQRSQYSPVTNFFLRPICERSSLPVATISSLPERLARFWPFEMSRPTW